MKMARRNPDPIIKDQNYTEMFKNGMIMVHLNLGRIMRMALNKE